MQGLCFIKNIYLENTTKHCPILYIILNLAYKLFLIYEEFIFCIGIQRARCVELNLYEIVLFKIILFPSSSWNCFTKSAI